MGAVDQLLARKSGNPGLVCPATSPKLSDDHKIIRVGTQSLLDNLIGHMRTVVVAGVDMVDAGPHGLAQNRDCAIHIVRWSPDTGTSKLHRTVAHAVQGHRCAG